MISSLDPCSRFRVRFSNHLPPLTHPRPTWFRYKNRIHIYAFDTKSSKLTSMHPITQQPLTSSPSTINLVRSHPRETTCFLKKKSIIKEKYLTVISKVKKGLNVFGNNLEFSIQNRLFFLFSRNPSL